MQFTEFGLNEQLLEAISYMGFEKATPIQDQAIPHIMQGADLIACAQTGTGKTAAYILPILNKIAGNNDHLTRALVIVPTRELALQIDQQFNGFGYFTDISSIPVYGGGDGGEWEQERKSLTTGADVIVATPGKLIAHLAMGYVKFDDLEYLVLDEADRMLDIGFHDDIMKIITYLPKKRQTLMFSATMAPEIRKMASKILSKPAEVSLEIAKPPEGVLQAVYLAFDEQKTPLINSLIADKPECKSILIFCSTKKKVAEISRTLKGNNYSVAGISSDLKQSEREEVLVKFRARQIRVLVATDVMSRGMDIKDINLVINYDAPQDAEDYVHRVGRTARAETTGIALTLVNRDDMYKLKKIEGLIEKEIIKIPLPAELGIGPEWDPRAQRPNKRHGGFHQKKRKR
ncbi:MAG: DEAD/DEAH box helicase [Bacteroidetes bacterium]|nr:DEAD/DEAH box helicase [Bacteroidota bacterium]MCK5765994.1 DEAD/DEAH box helicase [Bacteroidales bacterium]